LRCFGFVKSSRATSFGKIANRGTALAFAIA